VGGNVICYANLARQLGNERPFYAFQSQGLYGESLTTIEEMAAQYISEMRRVQGSGPYLLGGWSMGGLVAFEIAQQLLRHDEQISMLAMLDTAVPQALSDDIPQVGDNGLLRGFFIDLIGPSDGNGNPLLHERPELDGDELFGFLLQKIQAAKLLPSDMESEQILRLYELFKSNLCALRSYRPQACTAPISLAVASERRSLNESQLGWANLAKQLRVATLPGSHYTMLRPPHVAALAQWLETEINEATSPALAFAQS
jgi:thioesterase domain-containing protein